MTIPFDYPKPAKTRRHAPKDYADYASYRPFLRDEFSYRCAFCLLREQWGQVRGTFALDHFLPISLEPELATVYENLIYACAGCNSAKSDRIVPNPMQHLTASEVSPYGYSITVPIASTSSSMAACRCFGSAGKRGRLR